MIKELYISYEIFTGAKKTRIFKYLIEDCMLMCIKKEVILLFLFCFALLLLPMAYYGLQTSDDGWQHVLKAECYVANGGFPVEALYSVEVEECTSFPNYPPLWALLLGFGKTQSGILFLAKFLPALFGALCIFPMFWIARKFVERKYALLAAALGVLTPEFMVLSSSNAQAQVLGILFSLLTFN